jgi:hypothetical protein
MVDATQAKYPPDMMRAAQHPEGSFEMKPADLVEYVTEYAKQNPSSAMLWALGIGFFLGWRLKPW